ncbi:MFS transporter [Mycolicibacterium chubuense]|uniref:MFS transporter n=1 Tax=Mycolicibacterium chubuense TaxID=1800 RepID=UPI0002D3DFA8|nr:MFS transporter [Mycolicibacterium chubuense]
MRLGRRFGWLWGAYAVSAYGTGLGFGAFSYVAVTVLHANAAQVSALAVTGLAVGTVLAVPLGPWAEYRPKRPVMIAMDVTRFLAMATVPIAYVAGVLTFAQLLAVGIVSATAKIASNAASGAYLKHVVEPGHLLVATSRFESTTWSATVVGPVVGGAAIGLIGPVVTIVADSVSYLLSAVGVAAIGGTEATSPKRLERNRFRDLMVGWRYVWEHAALRRLFLNAVAVNALIMAAEPPLTVLMLDRLGFTPWQYGLAFGLPCVGGLIGSRLAGRVVARYGEHTVLVRVGALRALWPIGLAFVRPGLPGLVIVIAVEFALVLCISVHNPAVAAFRLKNIDQSRVARVLSAWSITSSAGIAVTTACWGVLADVAGPRTAIAAAGALLLATPVLLPGRDLDDATPRRRKSVIQIHGMWRWP